MKGLLSLARTRLHCFQLACNIIPHALACLVVDKSSKHELGGIAWHPHGSEPDSVDSLTQVSRGKLDSKGDFSMLPLRRTIAELVSFIPVKQIRLSRNLATFALG